MSTSKGTIQGYNAVTAADEKHQIIVNAECFGAGSEQQTLAPMIEGIEHNLDMDLGHSDTVVTAEEFSPKRCCNMSDRGGQTTRFESVRKPSLNHRPMPNIRNDVRKHAMIKLSQALNFHQVISKWI